MGGFQLMNKTAEAVIQKIDVILEDDSNFTTRMGLRFMTIIMREALTVIGEATDKQSNVDTRLKQVETTLEVFLADRKREKEQEETDRTKWRWAFVAPIIVIMLNELAKWIFR
jgi:hypothetical protein